MISVKLCPSIYPHPCEILCLFVGHIDEGGFRGVEAFIALDDDIWSAGAIFICTIFLSWEYGGLIVQVIVSLLICNLG